MTRDERAQKQVAFFIKSFTAELAKHLGKPKAQARVDELVAEAAKIGNEDKSVAPATNCVDDLV